MPSASEKPSILFTNLFMCARTGSELHLLELMEACVAKGWDVSCYVLVAAYPVLGKVQELGVSVIEFGQEERLRPSYDVLFAQHRMISDCLIGRENVAFKAVVVSVLGLGGMEALPRFADQADLLVFVSEEARDYAVASLGDGANRAVQRSWVLPNSAPEEFFRAEGPSLPATPRRVAVISNHVPTELQQLASVAPDVTVDLIGYETSSLPVTPELLTSYDLVVTIGRTVVDCLASRVPVFCYDHFGGPGYLTEEGLPRAAYHNFSGRDARRSATASELWQEICEGYPAAVERLDTLRSYALRERRLSAKTSLLTTTLGNLIRGKEPAVPAASWGSAQKGEDELLCELYAKGPLRDRVGVAQLYYGLSEADEELPSEERSLKVSYWYRTDISLEMAKMLPGGAKLLRFDPDQRPCRVRVASSGLRPVTAETSSGEEPGAEVFLTCDPIYKATEPVERIQFAVESLPLETTLEELANDRRRLALSLTATTEQARAAEAALAAATEKRSPFDRLTSAFKRKQD